VNRCKTQCPSKRSLNVVLLPRKMVKKEKKSDNFEVFKNSLKTILEKSYFDIEIVDRCNRQWYNDFNVSI